MNKRKLLGLLCLMTLLATSCDNKGDYWGAMESSKATLTLERICDMATLSQDSVELLSNILGMNTEELYRTDVVMIGKVTSEETGFYQYPRFLIAKDREMKEVLTEAYVHRDTEGTFYAFLESNMLPVGETYYCAMVDYNYGYNGRPGLLDHVLGGNTRGERYSEVKPFRLSGLPRLVVHDAHFTGYSFYLSAEVRFKSNGGIIEQGACYSSTKRIPTVDDQKTLARETRNYDYSFLEVEVTDLLPNTHYYIRPYVTTEEGTGYGPVVEFTTEPGTEPIIDYFTMYIDTDRSVNLYATFYIDNYQITHYGYSYGIYSPETGTVTDEQKIEVPFEDNHGQQLSKVITGLRPGIFYAFRVYAENGVGVTYSGYQTVKIPVE